MKKYLVLFNSKESAATVQAKTSHEQMKASMERWKEWRDEANKTVKFEFGWPLQSVGQIDQMGVAYSENQASGYAFMECKSKETIMNALQTHPHLERPGTTIDVFEILSIPGVEVK